MPPASASPSPAVAQIRKAVAAWVESTLPANAEVEFPSDAGHRLHLAIVLQHRKLAAPYEAFLEHFSGPRGAPGYAHLLAARDAGVLPPDLAAQLPPRQYVQAAVRMTRELEDLGRIALRGPFFHLLAQAPEPT